MGGSRMPNLSVSMATKKKIKTMKHVLHVGFEAIITEWSVFINTGHLAGHYTTSIRLSGKRPLNRFRMFCTMLQYFKILGCDSEILPIQRGCLSWFDLQMIRIQLTVGDFAGTLDEKIFATSRFGECNHVSDRLPSEHYCNQSIQPKRYPRMRRAPSS